jgi:hypothetical protein
MRILLIVVLMLGLVGCQTMPGAPGSLSKHVSGVDKSKEITMEPAWVGGDSLIKLALYKNDKLPEDAVVLTALVKGVYIFAHSESLQFNIDGKIYSFHSMDTITKTETDSGVSNGHSYYRNANTWSSMRYKTTKDFIEKLLDGKEVWVKIFLNDTYVEGKFSREDIMSAHSAFRNFYKKVWGTH